MVRSRKVAQLAKRSVGALTPGMGEVAERYGLNYNTIRMWRAGMRSPSLENLERLADVLDEQADTLRGLAAEIRHHIGS